MFSGFINIDKPAGMTSADVIARMKKLLFPIFGRFKIGHAGTLDPMATGVLPVACGEATKALPFIPNGEKAYVFDITFGRRTSTDDAEGETTAETEIIPTQYEIEKILPSFTGKIMQTPPAYSAIKVDGRRAYALARKGETPALKPREQRVEKLGLIKKIAPGQYRFEVVADRGFYVRSLARDIALALGSLGFVSMLRRTRSGPFGLEECISLDKLGQMLDNPASTDTRACSFCLGMSRALDGIPAIDMDAGQDEKLRGGRAVPFEIGDFPLLQIRFNGELSVIAKSERGAIMPVRVFNME